MTDMVNHPPHYKQYSFEVIELTELFPFCEGNAIKYILRAPFKGNFEQDLDKAIWYIKRAMSSADVVFDRPNLLLTSSKTQKINDLMGKLESGVLPHHQIQSVFLIARWNVNRSPLDLVEAVIELTAWKHEGIEKDQSERTKV